MNWEIKNFKKYKAGKLKGFFTLKAGIFEIHDCKYFEGDNAWVSQPDKKYTDKDGNDKYSPIVWIQEDKREGFQKWAITEIQKILPGDKPQNEQSVGRGCPVLAHRAAHTALNRLKTALE